MFMRHSLILSATSLFLAGAANCAQYTANSTNFNTVMAKVVGGDTVQLTGQFSGVTRLTNTKFASLVTIDASAATFANSLLLTGVSNVNVVGGHFGSATALTSYNKAVAVTGGTNVSFTNPNVVGFYTGQGIAFTGTTNASVTGATLSKLQAGIVLGGVTNGSITNSRSVNSVSDGFDIVDSNHVSISNNTCSGTTPTVGAHPDCVQMFSSAKAAPLSHITIQNNYASGDTQGFDNFGSVAGDSFISIVDNRVDGLFPQGIACYSCVDSTITGNTLTSLPGAPYLVNLNVLNGTNNTVSGNSIGALNRAAARPDVYFTRQQLVGNAAVVASATVAAVPEPAAWSLMIAGFGLIGVSQRTRQRYQTA